MPAELLNRPSKEQLLAELATAPNPIEFVERQRLSLPRSVAVICDGNGRWATQRGLPVTEGHFAGAEAIRQMLRNFRHFPEIDTVMLWALSPNNLRKRSAEELEGIYQVTQAYIHMCLDEIDEGNGRFVPLGDLEALPPDLFEKLIDAQTRTSSNTGQTVVLLLNYSGETEVLRGFQRFFDKSTMSRPKSPEDMYRIIDPMGLGKANLLIRTGGERRTSGLGWRGEDAELYFTDTLLPDFSDRLLAEILVDYHFRDQRFGGRPL